MTDRTRTPIGEMWVEDGILWHRLDNDLVVTADDAAETVRIVGELTGGEPLPAIVDMRGVAYAGPDVREMFAGDPGTSHEAATALLITTGSSRAMAQVFTRVTKPGRPVEVFTDADEAVDWLREVTAPPS